MKLLKQNLKEPKEIDQFSAIMIAEREMQSTEEEYVEAWQYLLDNGMVWQLQGSFGRQAQRLIDEGVLIVREVEND